MASSKKINPGAYLFIILCLASGLAFAKETIVIPDVNLKPKKKSAEKQAARIQTTHIDREQITESPVVNLTELLRQEQSIIRIAHSTGDSTQTALSLRGFSDNAVANSLILVDGFPLTNPSLLAPNFNSIPLSDIERIDIFQGSEGTLWGDQAVGGVVNIITRHPKKGFVDAVGGIGSFNKTYFSLLGGNKLQNGVFFKAYGLTSQTRNYRGHNQQNNDNIAAQGGLDYARGTLSLYLQSYNDTTNFPGGLSAQQFYGNPRQATDFNNFSHYRTQLVRLLNKHALNDEWVLEMRLNYHQTEGNGFIYLNYNRNDALGSIHPRLTGKIYHSKVILGYDGQVTRYQLYNVKVRTRANTNQNNLYLQTITPLTRTLDFTLGGRLAVQNNTAERIIGRPVNSTNRVFVTEQGLAYHPAPEWSLFLRRDGNFSFPKSNEATWVPLNVKSLHAQTGVSYETGVEKRTENQRSQISIYRLALDNEITFDPTQALTQPFGSFNNVDSTLRHGITLTEFYRFTPKLSLDSQLNYVNARFTAGRFSGHWIPAVPAFTGNLNIKYALTPHWQTQYGLLYTGTRYPSEDVANAGSKVPAYWLNNVSLLYILKPVYASFEVVNLFNLTYSTYTYYNSLTKTNTFYPGAGRSYLLTLKINIE